MKASDDVWLLNEHVSPELLSWSLVFKENAKIPVQVTGHLAQRSPGMDSAFRHGSTFVHRPFCCLGVAVDLNSQLSMF